MSLDDNIDDMASKRPLQESACSTTTARKTRKTARPSDAEPGISTNGESDGFQDEAQDDGDDVPPKEESPESSIQNTDVEQSLPSLKKPSFVLPRSSLHDRMRSLMPHLKQTPEELAALAKRPLEDVNEDSEHIAIELGLGVLQDASAETSSDDTSSDDNSERAEQDTSRLKKLMGEKNGRSTKVGIEEVG